MRSVQLCEKERNNSARMIEWTSEQEVALQRAYINQRPSQCFWLNIAKQVPGKTASECFHKFYSAHSTPPPALHRQPHSRRWDFTSPIKKFKPYLSPSRLVLQTKKEATADFRKKIRNMLIKQQLNRDQADEVDDFAALEQQCSKSSENENVAPNNNVKAAGEEASSSHFTTNLISIQKEFPATEKTVSTQDQDYNSPEVLKKYKDMKHLERYVDILVFRQKAMKRQKKHTAVNTSMPDKIQHLDLVSAKAAVIAGAQDFLRTGSKADNQCYDEASEDDLNDDALSDTEI